jgi:hypothetical protein
MKRNRFTSRKRISADATELSRLAIGLAESGSKLEDLFWQNRLGELVDKLFHDGAEDDFTGSLDRLFDTHAMAHDDLADTIEAHAESCVLSHLGQEFDILLFAAPLWPGRAFRFPPWRFRRALLQTLKVHLGAHVFAAGARLALADYLYSPDQLPHSFVDTWQLMQQLGSAAMAGSDLSYRRVEHARNQSLSFRYPLPRRRAGGSPWAATLSLERGRQEHPRERPQGVAETGRTVLRGSAHRLCL